MSQFTSPDPEFDYLRYYLIEEAVEDYQENRIPRREMLRRALLITGSIPLTASILAACTTPTPTPSTPAGGATSAPAGGASPAASPVAQAASPAAAPATAAPAPTAAAKGAPSPAPAGKTAPSPSPAGKVAGSPSPSPSPRSAVTVPPTDPAIEARDVTFPGPAGPVLGYLSTPRGAARAPGIIVIHENRDLTEHIKDVTRRYAKEGIVALGVDLLSRQGGTARVTDTAAIGAALSSNNQADLVRDLQAGVTYLKGLPTIAGAKVGVVGYCYGGGMAWLLAVNSPDDIGAAVPYYGAPPRPIDDVQKLSGPVLAFFGETDQRTNANIPAIEEAMAKYNKKFDKVIYPGAGHAFNNDTDQRYSATAARDAFPKSVAFFRENLRS